MSTSQQTAETGAAIVAKTAWATYRQSLLDITTQEGFPWIINWPVAP